MSCLSAQAIARARNEKGLKVPDFAISLNLTVCLRMRLLER